MFSFLKSFTRSDSNNEQKAPKKESGLAKRTRPVTKESINQILGLNWVDQTRLETARNAERSGRLFNITLLDNTRSHRHPCGDSPIDELDHNELFFIIANYDKDRKLAWHNEMQPGIAEDESDFLLEELAYAMYLQIKDRTVVSDNFNANTVPDVDIVRLIEAIGKSEYLSKNGCMMDLRDIATEKWLECDRKARADKKWF